jgi:hypothetical protein
MERTLVVAISGTRVSGVDVSVDPGGWQRMRYLALGIPFVNSTGVSAGRCRT